MKNFIKILKWLSSFIKTFAIALIPSVIIPVFFIFLFGLNTTATGRDILPPLNNPLEIIGFLGFIVFSLPMLVFLVRSGKSIEMLHDARFSVPVFDALPKEVQGTMVFILAVSFNILFWIIPVSFIRWLKKAKR
ncbi:MAG: hypothetical protein HN392_07385 [Anaerolineae bacterium]|jgi:hypothetical protein|nr:hypothetical protein [Anaerolineae bacterium]